MAQPAIGDPQFIFSAAADRKHADGDESGFIDLL